MSITEQRQLCAVRDRLERELAPCENRKHLDAVFDRMLKGFELGHGMSEADRQLLNGEYIDAVKGLPLSAVVAAAGRYRSGETLTPWKKELRPTSAQFAGEAKAGLVPTRAKLVHIRHILDAEVYDPPTAEGRVEVGKAMAAFLADKAVPRRDGAPAPVAEPVLTAAREQAIREQGRALADIAGSGGLDHLMARLRPATDEAADRQAREARA